MQREQGNVCPAHYVRANVLDCSPRFTPQKQIATLPTRWTPLPYRAHNTTPTSPKSIYTRNVTFLVLHTPQSSCAVMGGGQLPAVLMRPTPLLSFKTRGGGAVLGGGGLEGVGGGVRPRGGGVPKVGGLARDPLLPHAYLLGGRVSGGLYSGPSC